MKCHALAAVLLVAVTCLLPLANPALAPAILSAGEVPSPVSGLEFEENEDEETLRRRLIELTTARAGRLSADELRMAIAAAEGDSGKLPPAAQEILESLQAQAAEIRAEANRKIALHKQETIADLKVLMVQFTQQGKLDEAVAVRNLINALRMPSVVASADPGSMSSFSNRIGKSFHFQVSGTTAGSIYGTDVYTSDSTLAAAAVHAGVLDKGQTGIVKITMMPGQESYQGTQRNGISSYSYSSYSSSYRVEAVAQDEEKPE